MMAKELPTDSDYANSNKNLEAEDYEVDYAITYTCPLYQVRTLGCYHVAREEEPLQNYFQWVCDKLNQTNELSLIHIFKSGKISLCVSAFRLQQHASDHSENI